MEDSRAEDPRGTIAFISEGDEVTVLEEELMNNPAAANTLLIVVRNREKAFRISSMMDMERARMTRIAVLNDTEESIMTDVLRWMEGFWTVDIDITNAPPLAAAEMMRIRMSRDRVRVSVTLGSGRIGGYPGMIPTMMLFGIVKPRTNVYQRSQYWMGPWYFERKGRMDEVNDLERVLARPFKSC